MIGSECLFVCLLAGILQKKLWTVWRQSAIKDRSWQWYRVITFWEGSKTGTGSCFFFFDFLPFRNRAKLDIFSHTFTNTYHFKIYVCQMEMGMPVLGETA